MPLSNYFSIAIFLRANAIPECWSKKRWTMDKKAAISKMAWDSTKKIIVAIDIKHMI